MVAETQVRELRSQLIGNIQRWMPELEPKPRSTFWFGVFTRCAKEVDHLFEACTDVAIARAGPAAETALLRIARGKSPTRLTMGERLDILRTLDRQRLIDQSRKLLTKGDHDVLNNLVSRRNDFAHRQVHPDSGAESAAQFLDLARRFCESDLVKTLSTQNAPEP